MSSTTKEIIYIGKNTIEFLFEGKDTNGQLAMFESMVPVGTKAPAPHYHKDYDETIYGLEGVLTFTVDGKRTAISSGDTLFIPRGAVHGFDNLGNVNAKILATITPALIGPEYFKDTAEIINAGGPPDIEKLKAVLKKHGIEVAIPH